MAFNVNGTVISGTSGGAVTLGAAPITTTGQVQGTSHGFHGYKNAGGNFFSSNYGYWPIDTANWNSGAMSGGLFTAPVAGYYMVAVNGIANGSSNNATDGKMAFAKNGAISFWIHWNLTGGAAWDNVGGSYVFYLNVGDTLSLVVNALPIPTNSANAQSSNTGLYPSNHHAMWVYHLG